MTLRRIAAFLLLAQIARADTTEDLEFATRLAAGELEAHVVQHGKNAAAARVSARQIPRFENHVVPAFLSHADTLTCPAEFRAGIF